MLLSGHSASATQQQQQQSRAEPICSSSSSSSSRGNPPAAASTGQQCAGSMAKWIKEHLGFKSSKPPPPAPPKPDYREWQSGGASTHHHVHSALPHFPVTPAGQPDIVAAYKLQKERDFEDPYTTCAPAGSGQLNGVTSSAPTSSCAQSPSSPSHSPDVKYVSPKHRLIKVDTGEKGSCSPTGTNTTGSPGQAFTSPSSGVRSPPATSVAPQLEENKQDKVAIVEDYADPFDAKQVPGSQNAPEKVTENDGYMEPYEAQKMMEEIRRRGSKDLTCTPLPLYDTPYEPSENGFDSEGEKLTSQRPRESRLPQDDERPPEEYDQPWEWKKDRISKAFAVGQLDNRTAKAENDLITSYSQQTPTSPHFQCQASLEDSNAQFDSADKTEMSPAKEDKFRHMHRHSAGNMKAIKHPSVEHSISVGERIDPSLPLESQLSSQGFMHMKLSRTKENKYVLGQNSPPFNSVPEIIHHYASQKLPINGAEHMSLLYPVAVRML